MSSEAPKTGNGSAKEIELLLLARYSVIWVVTHERQRIEDLLVEVTGRAGPKLQPPTTVKVMTWGVTRGFASADKPEGDGETDPALALKRIVESHDDALYILRDFHPYLQDHVVRAWLRDAAVQLRDERDPQSGQPRWKYIVLVSPTLGEGGRLPPELEKEVIVFDWPLPDRQEVGEILEAIVQANISRAPPDKREARKAKILPNGLDPVVQAACGLTVSEIQNVAARSLVAHRRLDVPTIVGHKRQIVRQSGILEYEDVREGLAVVGGLDVLKEDLALVRKAFSPEAREAGVDMPKGVLISGIQGTGKSLGARSLAFDWGMPLLRADIGAAMGSLVGQSEANIRLMIKTAEAVAPCVLLLDEIEKGLSGSKSSGMTDSGVTARMFGTLLTWMAEKTSPVYIVATANSIEDLPPEFWRKGRFDEVYFVDLPGPDERQEIFRVHLRKRKQDPDAFDLASLAMATGGFSGAEIEEVVKRARLATFTRGTALNGADLLLAAATIVPQSKAVPERIEALRKWASQNARHANRTHGIKAAPATGVVPVLTPEEDNE